jgi:hypothetical protein
MDMLWLRWWYDIGPNKRNRTLDSCDDDDENGDDGDDDDDDGDDDETGYDDDENENRDDDDRNDDDYDSYCTIIIRMLETLNTYAYLQPFTKQGDVLDAQKLFTTKHRSIDLTASGPITWCFQLWMGWRQVHSLPIMRESLRRRGVE